MTHGYMLSDTGSNVYVQNLCRALVHEGHEVHLLCQEPEPLSYDFEGRLGLGHPLLLWTGFSDGLLFISNLATDI